MPSYFRHVPVIAVSVGQYEHDTKACHWIWNLSLSPHPTPINTHTHTHTHKCSVMYQNISWSDSTWGGERERENWDSQQWYNCLWYIEVVLGHSWSNPTWSTAQRLQFDSHFFGSTNGFTSQLKHFSFVLSKFTDDIFTQLFYQQCNIKVRSKYTIPTMTYIYQYHCFPHGTHTW